MHEIIQYHVLAEKRVSREKCFLSDKRLPIFPHQGVLYRYMTQVHQRAYLIEHALRRTPSIMEGKPMLKYDHTADEQKSSLQHSSLPRASDEDLLSAIAGGAVWAMEPL